MPGAEAHSVPGFYVRAEARTYLTNKGKDNGNCLFARFLNRI